MFYFIPDWHQNAENLNFDDTINQIKMFHQTDEAIKTIILDYTPDLLYMLHQQELVDIAYWSVFDEIQHTQNVPQRLLNIDDLNWGGDVEFVYTPFRINVLKQGELYAQVIVGNSGQFTKVRYFLQGVENRVDIFDTRGFISSTVYPQLGYQSFYDRYGAWQVRLMLKPDDQRVLVNPEYGNRFNQSEYHHLDELKSEILTKYFSSQPVAVSDVIVLAANQSSNDLVFKVNTRPSKTILSFFGNRFDMDNVENLVRSLSLSDLAIVDTPGSMTNIKTKILQRNGETTFSKNLIKRIQHVSPYDARFELGSSQRYKRVTVLTVIEQLNLDESTKALTNMVTYMIKNHAVDLVIATHPHENEAIQLAIQQLLVEAFSIDDNVSSIPWNMNESPGENQIEDVIGDNTAVQEVIKIYQRILFEDIMNEDNIVRAFQRVRLIVDVNQIPNIFVQIAGISAGIPQINFVATPYVQHQKNGYIIDNINNVTQAMDYYLQGLKNWNTALVYSVNKIQQYTGGAIVDRWKEILGN